MENQQSIHVAPSAGGARALHKPKAQSINTMQAMLAAVLAFATGAAGFLPASLPPRLASRGQVPSSMIMNADSSSGQQDAGGAGEGLLTRAGWLQVCTQPPRVP